MPIEDGQTPPPGVGEIGRYPLIFSEADSSEADASKPDATVSTFQVRAEPHSDRFPYRVGWARPGREPMWVWPTLLHGDGWSAHWPAPRPVLGQVRLRGTLVGDVGTSSREWVRGRVTRARIVTETIDTTSPDRLDWRPVPHLQRLREVDTAPRWFDHGLVAPPEATAPGWYCPVPGDPYVREVGVLVELDLDDVPALPPRPSIVPGALSASGPDLWVADTRLPLVVRLRNIDTAIDPAQAEVAAFPWPGRILDTEQARGRQLHADPDGCWITGPDGIHRCDPDGTVRLVRDESAWLSAANKATLAVQVLLHPGDAHTPVALRLLGPSGAVTDVPLPDRDVEAVVPAGSGFLVLLRHRDPLPDPASGLPGHQADHRPWLATVSRAGELTEGPYLALGRAILTPLIAATPPLVYEDTSLVPDETGNRGGPRRVLPDLTLEEGIPMPRRFLSGWSVNGRMWIASHPPHPYDIAQRGPQAYWPLAGLPTYPEDRQYWLLTELDPADLRPIITTLVHEVPRHLAVDGAGTVWVQSDGVRHLPTRPGAAEHLDVAALLDQARQHDTANEEPNEAPPRTAERGA